MIIPWLIAVARMSTIMLNVNGHPRLVPDPKGETISHYSQNDTISYRDL